MTTTSAAPLAADLPTPRRQKGARGPGNERFSVSRTVRYALLLFFLVVILIPVYVLLVTSFKGPGDAAATRDRKSVV